MIAICDQLFPVFFKVRLQEFAPDLVAGGETGMEQVRHHALFQHNPAIVTVTDKDLFVQFALENGYDD